MSIPQTAASPAAPATSPAASPAVVPVAPTPTVAGSTAILAVARIKSLFSHVGDMKGVLSDLDAIKDQLKTLAGQATPSTFASFDAAVMASNSTAQSRIATELAAERANSTRLTSVEAALTQQIAALDRAIVSTTAERDILSANLNAANTVQAAAFRAALAAAEASFKQLGSAQATQFKSLTDAAQAATLAAENIASENKRLETLARDSLAAKEKELGERTKDLDDATANATVTQKMLAKTRDDIRKLEATLANTLQHLDTANLVISNHNAAIDAIILSITQKIEALRILVDSYEAHAIAVESASTFSATARAAEIAASDAELLRIRKDIATLEAARGSLEAAKDAATARATASEDTFSAQEAGLRKSMEHLTQQQLVAQGLSSDAAALRVRQTELARVRSLLYNECRAVRTAFATLRTDFADAAGGLIGIGKLYYSSREIVEDAKYDTMSVPDRRTAIKHGDIMADANLAPMYSVGMQAVQAQHYNSANIRAYVGTRTGAEERDYTKYRHIEDIVILFVAEDGSVKYVFEVKPAQTLPASGNEPDVFGKIVLKYRSTHVMIHRQISKHNAKLNPPVITSSLQDWQAGYNKTTKELQEYLAMCKDTYRIVYGAASDEELRSSVEQINIVLNDEYLVAAPGETTAHQLNLLGKQFVYTCGQDATIRPSTTPAHMTQMSPVTYNTTPLMSELNAVIPDTLQHRKFWKAGELMAALSGTKIINPPSVTGPYNLNDFMDHNEPPANIFSEVMARYLPDSTATAYSGANRGVFVIAAGASGTGKTTTLLRYVDPAGVLPPINGMIMYAVSKMLLNNAGAVIYACFVDVYLQKARVLLRPDATPVNLSTWGDSKWDSITFPTGSDAFTLPENAVLTINDANHFMYVKAATLDRIRVVRATALNADSSRSHLFIVLAYTKDDAQHPSNYRTTIFADLAGDENTALSRDTVTGAEMNAMDEYNTHTDADQIQFAEMLRSFAVKVRNNVMINAEGTAITADLSIMKDLLRGEPKVRSIGGGASKYQYYTNIIRDPGKPYREIYDRRRTDARTAATTSDVFNDSTKYPIYEQYLDVIAANATARVEYTPVVSYDTDIAKLLTLFRAKKNIVLFGMVKLTGVSGGGVGTTLDFVASAAKGREGPALVPFRNAITAFGKVTPTTCDNTPIDAALSLDGTNDAIIATAIEDARFKALVIDILRLTKDANAGLTTTYTFDSTKLSPTTATTAAPVITPGGPPTGSPPGGGGGDSNSPLEPSPWGSRRRGAGRGSTRFICNLNRCGCSRGRGTGGI